MVTKVKAETPNKKLSLKPAIGWPQKGARIKIKAKISKAESRNSIRPKFDTDEPQRSQRTQRKDFGETTGRRPAARPRRRTGTVLELAAEDGRATRHAEMHPGSVGLPELAPPK